MKKLLINLSAFIFCTVFFCTVAFGHSTTIVISNVYGGGGSAAAGTTFQKDFVELKNVSNAPQSTSGLLLAYGSATGQFGSSGTNFIALNAVTLQPGQYYLILLGPAGTAGAVIPNFDQTTTNLTMSGTNGKVALVTSSFVMNSCGATATPCALSSTSPSAIGIVDLVSYGTANNAEGGTAVGVLSTTTAAFRASSGCSDTDRNNIDFSVAAATVPNYTGTAFTSCNILDITNTNTLPNGNVAVAYTNSLIASGGTAPYTFTVVGGSVPTGLTLNTDGTWSGLPTTGGIYNFDVRVDDSTPFAPRGNFVPNNNNTTTESFQITVLAPLAAEALISGRVTDVNGRGLAKVTLTLSGGELSQPIVVRTNAFGYYTFPEVEIGATYTLTVSDKRYTFANPSRVINLQENISDADFVSEN